MRTQALRAALLAVVAGAGLVAAGVPPAAASHTAAVTAAPSVRLSRDSGPPTSRVRVSGTGFGAHRAVDIYFDTTDKAQVTTNGNGAFSGIPVTVPASAVPGTHHITAVQRHSSRRAQARFLVNTNWDQFRHTPSHTGVNRYENVLSPSNVAGLGLDWRFRTRGIVNSSPSVVNGVVYIGSDDRNLYALNAATGAKLWRFAAGNYVFSSPAVARGVVYACDGSGICFALNAATGAKLWSFDTFGQGVQASPTVTGGVVYITSGDSNALYALNAATGAKKWMVGLPTNSTPTVANGVVYVCAGTGDCLALNAATGAKKWRFNTGSRFGSSSPAVANGVVYVGTDDGTMYALNAATGAKKWSFNTGSLIVSSSPAVANGAVYIGLHDGGVDALNAATGALLWSSPTSEVDASPAVANGVVYVGSNGTSASPGTLYALNAATGAKVWSFTGGGGFFPSPAVANGVVYVGSSNHSVYAFHLPVGIAGINRPNPRRLHPNYALRLLGVVQDGEPTPAEGAGTGYPPRWGLTAASARLPGRRGGVPPRRSAPRSRRTASSRSPRMRAVRPSTRIRASSVRNRPGFTSTGHDSANSRSYTRAPPRWRILSRLRLAGPAPGAAAWCLSQRRPRAYDPGERRWT